MKERFGNLLHVVLLLAIVLLAGFLSTRHRFTVDLTHAQRSSLSEASLRLLATLDGPVEVVSYARREGELRTTIARFFDRYRRAKPDLALTFVDPDEDPGAARAAGVQVDGEMDLRYAGRSERLKVLAEGDVSSALLRLSRDRARIATFLEGEGERRPDGMANADLGQFNTTLHERGIRAVNLSLASTPRVPDNVDLLVIANPRVALQPQHVAELVDYVERGGNLLWLLEPGESVGLDALAEALSLQLLPGVVVDGTSSSFGIGDPSFVAVNRYPEHALTKGFELATLFPQPVALAQRIPSRWAFAALLKSSTQSWNEVGHIPKPGEADGNVRFDGTDGETAGPLDLGVALTRLSPKPGGRDQRVVVIGDGDFLSNSFLGNAGNREFGARVFDWLLADDALVDVPERAAPDRHLALSDLALAAISVGFLVVLPLLLAITGLVTWRVRRRR